MPRKALDQLVAIMPTVGPANIHLPVLGTGPQERQLREQARQQNVADRIHFLGYVDEPEKFRILGMSDIFVSTSQHEGFGLVFLEAMASGLPVICYDHGGQTDFLESGRTGYLTPLNDLGTFVDYCQQLITDVSSRRQMGHENLRTVEHFFIDHCAARYEQVFNDTIAEFRKVRRVGYSHRS